MSQDLLIEKTDKAIAELVRSKYDLLKAYNYYNGIRDADLFRYLEEVYGVNTPTTIHFTPLIKKHIDALIGEYLGTPILPKIYCKDSETITNIDREKLLLIAKGLVQYLKKHLKNSVLSFIKLENSLDNLVALLLKKVVEDIDNSFMSLYEIAAQDVLTYVMQSRTTDIITVLRDLLFDLLVTGYMFYKVEPSSGNNNVKIKVLSPLNTFPDRNFNTPYVKDSYRVVVRYWKTKDEILRDYGKELSREDKAILENKWNSVYDTAMYYVRMGETNGVPSTDGLQAGMEVTPGYPDSRAGSYRELIPVYEVEWTETDKNYIMLRYETIRIGEEIYILRGRNDEVIRSKSNPLYCPLSVNGVYFLNRGIKPYSMVLACAHLQDLYDLLCFYRDNLIANSGTVGDWIDYTLIPAELGVNLPERIMKWLSYKKLGLAILDSSLEGIDKSPLNTIFNGYDNTVKALAILAIQLAIDAIELTTSSITGVFRERLNGIEARDAVTNVQIGLKNSFVVTKQYYHLMDLVVNELLLDCLNLAKIVFKNGLIGTITLGDKRLRVFTALPEYFTLTDHDVRVITSSEAIKDIELIKAVIPEFIKAGNLPPDLIIEALTSKSIPDLKHKVKLALRILKEENNLIALLTLQVELLLNLLKEMSQLLLASQLQVQKLNLDKLLLQLQEMLMKYLIEWYKANTDRTYKEATVEELKKRTEVEIALLYDGNPYNDKVRQLGF